MKIVYNGTCENHIFFLDLLIQMIIDKSDSDMFLVKLDKILVTISKNQLFVLYKTDNGNGNIKIL